MALGLPKISPLLSGKAQKSLRPCLPPLCFPLLWSPQSSPLPCCRCFGAVCSLEGVCVVHCARAAGVCTCCVCALCARAVVCILCVYAVCVHTLWVCCVWPLWALPIPTGVRPWPGSPPLQVSCWMVAILSAGPALGL